MHYNSDIEMAASIEEEYDRQVANLLTKGYPAAAGKPPEQFMALVQPLRDLLAKAEANTELSIPFVIVVKGEIVPTTYAVEQFVVRDRSGFTDMADELASYQPIQGVDVPDTSVYLLTDIDTGAATLNVRPNDALPIIIGAGRTPLTIDEGVAVVTHFPEVLKVRNCFQSLGSRTANKRIPSFWVSKGQPRLGWCWAGNPHTWLGAGSAAARHGNG